MPVLGERSFVLVASLKRGEVCPSDAFCDLLSHGKSKMTETLEYSEKDFKEATD